MEHILKFLFLYAVLAFVIVLVFVKILESLRTSSSEARIEINDEFSSALETIEERGANAFITGNAGTGKSTLLRHFRDITSKNLVILAPTGIAAINVRGQTIHSFFKLPPRFIDPRKIKPLRNQNLIRSIQTLVIDEVSMVRADLMDGIDKSLRINRDRSEPFGGVQLVMFGDLFQLPPIVRERELQEYFRNRYGGPYFFLSRSLNAVRPKLIELHKVYRQSDKHFVSLLNRIRTGDVDKSLLETINDSVHTNQSRRDQTDAITLTTTNRAAHNINMERLANIRGGSKKFRALVSGKFPESAYPTEQTLQLKRGARIMMVKNDPERRWVNGSIGKIAKVSNGKIFIHFGGDRYEVTRANWENVKYKFDARKNKIVQEVIGTFTQYPLRLAWAITIHKSQGQTFKKVHIDFGTGAFAHGQAYVALSRCTSLDGISLARPVFESDMVFDKAVHGYSSYFS